MSTVNDRRRRELARIHIAAHALGMDDGTYRDMLWTVARVRSAGDLDYAGRQTVLDHLKALGFKARKRVGQHPGRPHSTEVRPQIAKIEALLAEAERPWAYAVSMARRMCGKARLEFCTPDELGKVIAALMYDAKRHGRATA